MVVRRQRQKEEPLQGEPSALRRSRGDGSAGTAQAPEPEDPILRASEPDELGAHDERKADDGERSPEDVSQQLKRLARQIHTLEQQVEEVMARGDDGLADQAGEKVAAIVQAAEESVAEIKLQARKEAGLMRDRLLAEAEAEADRIRVEAQADAKTIRTDAHAAAAALREQAIAELRSEVERVCAHLGHDLLASAREAIEAVASGAKPASRAATELRAEPRRAELGEAAEGDVEEAVDELQSAASVLEQSLRHLQEIGRKLPETESLG